MTFGWAAPTLFHDSMQTMVRRSGAPAKEHHHCLKTTWRVLARKAVREWGSCEGAPATNMMLSKVGAAIPQAPAGSVLCNVANCGVNLPITAATCGRLWQKHALNQRLNYNHPTRSTVLCKGYRNPNARRPAPIYPAFRTSQSTTIVTIDFNAAHSPQTSLPDSSSYHPALVDAPKPGSCGTCSPHSHPNHHSLLMAQEYEP